MNWRRIFFFVLVALVLFYVISNPHGAAGLIGNVWAWLKQAFNGVITFLQATFSQIFG